MRFVAVVLLALASTTLFSAASAAEGYYRYPALHDDTVVFTAEGDLWKVPLGGGEAKRLTTHPGAETHAAISPDGKWVAFTASYEGPAEAYVMPLAGGVPKRLTWFGSRAEVAGWTPDGKVLIATPQFHPLKKRQLVVVSPVDGTLTRLPLYNASQGVFTAPGTLVFARGETKGDNARRYRGGAIVSLWQFKQGGEAVALTDGTSNDTSPMLWGERIVFLSDRDGVTNIWSMDRGGHDVRQHTRHKDFEVRWASVSGNHAVYQLGPDLRVLDLATGSDSVLPISLVSDFDQQRERWVKKPLEHFTAAELSDNGERLAIVARGHAVTAGIGALRRVDIALPASSRARSAVLMPDGKSVLAICDASGETELWLFPADGSGPGRQLTHDADTTRLTASPSPDGKWIVHTDRKLRLWLLEVASGKNRLLETQTGFADIDQPYREAAWAPDSSAFAVEGSVPGTQFAGRILLFRVADGKKFELTSARYSSAAPAFSPDGKWLWFLSDRHLVALNGSPWGERNMGPYFDKRTQVFAVALQEGSRFPFLPKDELEKDSAHAGDAKDNKKDDKESKDENEGADGKDKKADTKDGKAAAKPKIPPIAWEGLAKRLYEVPMPSGNYEGLASDGKRLWFLDADTAPPQARKTVLKFIAIDNAGAPPEVFLADVRQFGLSRDSKKLFYRKWAKPGEAGDMFIVDAAPKLPGVSEISRYQVKLADWEFSVAPRLEWKQMFDDAWRMRRDWFFDTDLRGVDWPAIHNKYAAMLPRVTDRYELADVLGQMSAELPLMHSQVRGGDLRKGDDNVLPATLGAVLENAGGVNSTASGVNATASGAGAGVRIVRIYRADPELVDDLPPLARPEAGAKDGDIIVAVDGAKVADVNDLAAKLRDRAEKQVLLALRSPAGVVRKTIVRASAAIREGDFLQHDWEWQRREKVETASKGRFGYIYLRAMTPPDLASFAREFYPIAEREGLVIDVRDNNGGSIDSIVIEKLMRRAWEYWRQRNGSMASNMQSAFRGPIVVLIDAGTYSDGETFSEGIKKLGLGTLVGKRTAGAGVWLGDGNRLMDGGIARSAELAQIGLDGEWLVEGKGVTPDVEVDNPPHATFMGEDAQLDAAIRILNDKLREKPVVEPSPPVFRLRN